MKRMSGLRLYPLTLFSQFFISFFILFLVPVMAASIFTYFFVVQLVEVEAEKSNQVLLRSYAEETDALFSSIQNQMINLLNSSNMKSAARLVSYESEQFEYYEEAHRLINQLNTLSTQDSVAGAFLYFAHQDLVVSQGTHSSKSVFFNQLYQVDPKVREEYEATFTGKKMMSFSKPYAVYEKIGYEDSLSSSSPHLSVIMSYPFNAQEPDVYLAVNLDQNKLAQQIRIQEEWVKGTIVLDRMSTIIAQSGHIDMEAADLLDIVREEPEGMTILSNQKRALSVLQSSYNEAWHFVSYIDLGTLLKPTRSIRTLSIWFMAFLLIVGAIVSYTLSRRLYKPIREIKAENKELTALISGMAPIVQEDFIAKMLLGEYRDSLSIEYYAKEIDFDCHPKMAKTVLCIEIQYYSAVYEQLSETTKSFTVAELKERITKAAPGVVWLCQPRSDQLACIVNHDAVLHFGPSEAAGIVELVLALFSNYFKATIGIGKTVNEIGDLHLSYKSALAMLRYKSLHPRVEIFSEENAWDDRMLLDSFLTGDEVKRIFNLYKSGEDKKLLYLFYELLDAGMRKEASAYQVKTICADVLNTWIRALEKDRNDLNIPFYSELYEKLNRCVTWDEIKLCFHDIHFLLFRRDMPRDPSRQIADILDYIHQHFAGDHSIEQLAERANMSVSHFSRTFKEEVGEKYVEYVAKYRLAKAKELLLSTNMKIDDVAENVGYMGRNSFIRIFRKYEGITPGRYRQLHQRA
ncbi:helix-turn-helix domain-containing protein [Paenibacillus puerhi]|uniref:helix-turn-helix domain-containing protein n=1 Tax=Paenibacillus puerhi TaxID=2692622 RepID=UPI0013583508|nr:helix-turn-helix domain-containing protein [Paenibacillus puerhi]